jgi:Na+-translocating ferredoxin:NAD+ oxidoreductase RnfD subunit
VGNWRAPLAALLGLLGLSALLHALDPARFLSPLLAPFAGSFLFGATYMLTDPVSAPSTNLGRYVYGLAVGCLVVLIRGLSGYPEGMMFSILIMNIFSPLIDQAILARHRRSLRHVQG